jgi:Zinc knuckle
MCRWRPSLIGRVKANLLDEERHLIEAGKLNKATGSAMQAGCHNNHPQTAEEKVNYARWLKTAPCYECGEIGHVKAKCPKKTLTPSKSAETNQVTLGNSDSEPLAVFFVDAQSTTSPVALLVDPSSHKDAWVIDSGCTNHMSCQLSKFVTYSPFPMLKVIHLPINP